MSAILTQMALLEGSGLVALAGVEPELIYSFRHPLMQEIAYSSLTRAGRKQLHQAIAQSLETLYPDRLEELAPILGDHFDKAGDTARALHYYRIAARAAQRIYANPEAVMYYQRALEIVLAVQGDSRVDTALLVDLCQNLGRVLELAGQYDAAVRHYQDMEAFARRSKDRPLELAALLARLTVLATPTTRLDPDLARSLAHHALELAGELGDRPAEAKIYWNLLLANYFSDDISKAREYGEQSLDLARSLNLREQLAYTLNDLGSYVYLSEGKFDRSVDALEEARSIWSQIENLPMLADNLSNSAGIYFLKGNLDKSFELAGEAFQLSKSIGNQWGQAYSLGVVGLIYAHLGFADLAMSYFDEAMRIGSGAGFAGVSTIGNTMKAFLLGNFGLISDGIEHAKEGIRTGGAIANFWVDQAYGCLAWLYTLQGSFDEAEVALRQSKQSERALEEFLMTSLITTAECELRLARADYPALLEYTEPFLQIIRKHGADVYLPDCLYFHGRALAGLQRWDEAHQAFQEAGEWGAKLNLIRLRWKIHAGLAEVELCRGSRRSAKRRLRETRELIAALAEHAGSQAMREAFLAQPSVRRVEGLGE